MFLKQYYLGCLAHASYLIGDKETGAAAVVDPQRDVDLYLQDAQDLDLQIRHVLLSHLHADFVAGHLELRDQVGARIYLGAQARAEYEFTPMKDQAVLELGQVRLEILETPGHSPESISIVVYDLEKSEDRPHAVLTGDTLFIGDVGRPDLRASLGWSASELGAMLYDSLHRKLMALPDETLVYPAHGAGSLCGKNLGKETVSTIGVQRRYNYALQPMSREEFVGMIIADQPDAPAYFTYDAILNSREHATLEETLERTLRPLSFQEVLRLQEEGAQLLDSRNPEQFAGIHVAGSANIGLGGTYATWAGTLLDPEKAIVIIAEPGKEEEAAVRLGRIGFDHVAGYLKGGLQALRAQPEQFQASTRIEAATLAEQLASADPPAVLDVRTEKEWLEKRIEGSLHIPLNQLQERIADVPRDRLVAVHCASGYRSSIAVSLLERDNRGTYADLIGGIAAWEAARLPTVPSRSGRG